MKARKKAAKDLEPGMKVHDSGLWFGRGKPPVVEVNYTEPTQSDRIHIVWEGSRGETFADPDFMFEIAEEPNV